MVTSAEKSFSELKLIKSYLMSHKSLSDLAIFYIERELLREVEFEKLVDDFIEKKGRSNVLNYFLFSSLFCFVVDIFFI